MDELLHSLFRNFGYREALDVGILTLVCFRLYLWIRGTVAFHVVVGLLIVGGGALAASRAGLLLTTYLLQLFSALGVLLIFSLFQPEIRRAMLHASPLRWLQRQWLRRRGKTRKGHYRALAEGIARLAEQSIGALVVIPRHEAVEEHLTGGREIQAAVDPALLEALFQTSSPLHDGAIVVRNGWMERAGAVLPLAVGGALKEEHGTRHRAAVGLSEACDALVLVVSEERGEIAVASGGALQEVPREVDVIAARIDQELEHAPDHSFNPRADDRPGALRRYGGAALALVTIVALVFGAWYVFFGDRATVHSRSVDLELRDVPKAVQVEVIRPKSYKIRVRVRGPAQLLTGDKLREIAVWVNVGQSTKPGYRRPEIHVKVPTGLSVVDVDPKRALLRIRKSK